MEKQITPTKKVKMSQDATGKYFIRLVQGYEGSEQILESKWSHSGKGAKRIFNNMCNV
jgi:hypothetical protein